MEANVVDGAFLGGTHPVFDLGEGLLDRIEVGRVGRQIPQPRTRGVDEASERGRLVAAEIIHDDDVAGLEDRNELLLDIGPEAFAVDWAVEDARGRELIAAQGAEEGQRPPVAMRRETAHPTALGPPSAQRRHAGLDPGLVDEDQTPRVETGLP